MTSVRRRRPLSHCLSVGACEVCRGPISSSAATSAAPARCLDCCKSLCAGCATAHRQTAVTAGHSLYDPDLVSAVLQDPDALSCLEHRNETVAYYCSDCERCVCVLCTFDCVQSGQPHHQHDIIDFNAAVTRLSLSQLPRIGFLFLFQFSSSTSSFYPFRHIGILASHPGQLSLVIPPWVGEMSILAIVTATAREENGEFCVTVGPVTRTVAILIVGC